MIKLACEIKKFELQICEQVQEGLKVGKLEQF
jgi:hypothetical protein